MDAFRRLICAFMLACLANGVAAQSPGEPQPSRPSVVLVDINRLYVESLLGQRLEAEYLEAEEALAGENRQIEEQLTAEERSLTERRPTMDAEDFRAEAEAFDVRVQEIRAAQDAKETVVVQSRAENFRMFRQTVAPILGEIMQARGASIVLEQGTAILWADGADITLEAIERVNATLGDGAN